MLINPPRAGFLLPCATSPPPKQPDRQMNNSGINALLSYESDKERAFKEKRKKLRYVRPKETDQQGDLALARFLVNHRLLSEIGERTVLHNQNGGLYGKPGDSKYEYIFAWLKDIEYERMIDHADETFDLARAANKAAEDAAAEATIANKLAHRAIAVAIISAVIAMITLVTTI